ncbi:hypothetical protein PR202_ga27007 [Eleusine coracana subsp. coracana]|uniref:BTB domain-containing protein n=1 Tax=Eleusine coracana subsp. coracana TaxID=191504 RepID=A0AAV5DGI1_ELECO|nr:hypothetical protein PR202_ga27007 [Eleusine coracana subsp. coracana]
MRKKVKGPKAQNPADGKRASGELGAGSPPESRIPERLYAIRRIAPTSPPAPKPACRARPAAVVMQSPEPSSSSPVLLNIGGKKYATTVETLTQREPDSMLAAMFSGRHTLPHELTTGMVFVDRDGKHFRHVLNWLRDGAIPVMSESKYQQLLREAEYYQLLGLVDYINERLDWKKIENSEAELTRKDVIKCIQSQKCRFRGVNLSGLDLSKLVSLGQTCFRCSLLALLTVVFFVTLAVRNVEASSSSFRNTNLRDSPVLGFLYSFCSPNRNNRCEFIGANLQEAVLDGANLRSANLQDACLTQCSFIETDLHSAHLQTANLAGSNLKGANLEAANLKGAKLYGTNLQDANLQRAYLREVDLRGTLLTGAKLGGANLLGAIR